MSDDVARQKSALRELMKARRRACTDRPARDGEIFARFFALPQARSAASYFLYNAFSHEAATRAIALRLLHEGKEVYFPRTRGKEMHAVRFYEGQALQKGTFGIEEPQGEPYFGKIEVCVLPLLAADTDFFRLGYGGGYYDRFLSDRNIYKIGLCYDFQLVDKVPREPHDAVLDALVTDKRTLVRS